MIIFLNDWMTKNIQLKDKAMRYRRMICKGISSKNKHVVNIFEIVDRRTKISVIFKTYIYKKI